MKRIAIDLAKSVYQVAESVQVGRVDRGRRRDAGAFARYVQEQIEPVEWVMEACGTAHHWGRLMQEKGHCVGPPLRASVSAAQQDRSQRLRRHSGSSALPGYSPGAGQKCATAASPTAA